MKKHLPFLVIIFLLLIAFFLLGDTPAFWDARSKFGRANWLYQNDFASLVVPTEYNSGHPPLWIWSIALFWKVFGKAIWSARLLLLIVNIGVFYQLLQLGKKVFATYVPYLAIVLVCVEPTLVGQTTMLNNDMLLLFFTLLGLNSLLNNRWILYAIALTGILFSNLRGMYIALAFILIHFSYVRYKLLSFKKSMLKSYVIATGLLGLFFMYQYQELGWIIITKSKVYAGHREPVGVAHILKNTAAFIKNLLDFGRVFIWVPLALLLLKSLKNSKIRMDRSSLLILIPLLIFSMVFFIGMVPFSNPMGPRYLMICFLLAIFLFLNLIFNYDLSKKLRNGILGIAALGLLTGHLWVYPATISQGWDSSLAYLRYFDLEEQMIDYIKNESLNSQEIGTHLSFNNRWSNYARDQKDTDLLFAKADIATNSYYLFSNIENTTKDEEIKELEEKWTLLQEYCDMGVFMKLYKK